MTTVERLKKEAKSAANKALHEINNMKNDIRFRKTIGLLKRNRLMDVNRPYPYLGKPDLNEMIWAGQIEPRIYELIPAIVLKRPKLILLHPLPEEVKQIVAEIRKGHPTSFFYGVEPKKYMEWVSHVGRKGKLPSAMKTFRLQQSDLELLRTIARREGINETEVIRRGLKTLIVGKSPPKR